MYGTEKTLADLGDKVPEDTKSDVEAAMAEVKKALEGDDVDAISTATETLQAEELQARRDRLPAGAGRRRRRGRRGGAEADASRDEEEVADYEVVDGDE